MNKLTGFALLALAVVLAVVPLFTDCHSQGRSLTTKDGKTVDMKCHWTGIAEVAVAIPLGLIGIMNITGKRKESLRFINILALSLGALAVLLPTVLIGVCANPTMVCNMLMKPVLILSGVLVGGFALFGLVMSRRMPESAA